MVEGMFTEYMDDNARYTSETPADTIPEGKYPGEIINAKVRFREGTSQDGVEYAFGELSVQVKVLQGRLKGQTTWVRLDITAPDPSGDETIDKRRTYFTQHKLDATGLGKIMDPSWSRTTKPHPNKPGKEITVFSGNMLKRAALLAIAKDSDKAKQFETFIGGAKLNGIFNIGMRTFTLTDGGEGEANTIKDIVKMTDEAISKWQQGAAGEKGSSPASSPYDAPAASPA